MCAAPPTNPLSGRGLSGELVKERPCVEPYLETMHVKALTYGVPWQIVAGVLEAEFEIPSQFNTRGYIAMT